MLVEFTQTDFVLSENAAMYDTRQYLQMSTGGNTANVSTSQITAKYISS